MAQGALWRGKRGGAPEIIYGSVVDYYAAALVAATTQAAALTSGQINNMASDDLQALTTAQGLIDQNADVLLPVGGPIYFSAAEAIRDSGRSIALMGVDKDIFVSDPDIADLVLTSVLKNISTAVYDVVTGAATGGFDSAPYVGTLENGGVGIAPFHDFESAVDAELAGEVEALIAGIIDGSIEVTSPASPGQ